MRLTGYGPGEMIDRIGILSMKIEVGHQKGKKTDHFLAERTALATALSPYKLDGGALFDAIDLTAVNGLMWEITDALRHMKDRAAPFTATEYESVADQSLWLMDLNDRRAMLIKRINDACGHQDGEEKLL